MTNEWQCYDFRLFIIYNIECCFECGKYICCKCNEVIEVINEDGDDDLFKCEEHIKQCNNGVKYKHKDIIPLMWLCIDCAKGYELKPYYNNMNDIQLYEHYETLLKKRKVQSLIY